MLGRLRVAERFIDTAVFAGINAVANTAQGKGRTGAGIRKPNGWRCLRSMIVVRAVNACGRRYHRVRTDAIASSGPKIT